MNKPTSRDIWQAFDGIAPDLADLEGTEVLDPVDHVEVVTHTLQFDGFNVTYDEVRAVLSK